MAEEKFVDPELLLKYYLDDKLSTRQIGEIFNITHGVIKTKLKKLGVEIRPFNSKEYYRNRTKYAIQNDPRRSYVKIAEEQYGGNLPDGAVIHHRDRNRKNSSPDNLFIFPSSELHNSYHEYLRAHDYIEPEEFLAQYQELYERVLSYDFLKMEYIDNMKSVKQISDENKPISRLVITSRLKEYGIWKMRKPTVNQYDTKCE